MGTRHAFITEIRERTYELIGEIVANPPKSGGETVELRTRPQKNGVAQAHHIAITPTRVWPLTHGVFSRILLAEDGQLYRERSPMHSRRPTVHQRITVEELGKPALSRVFIALMRLSPDGRF